MILINGLQVIYDKILQKDLAPSLGKFNHDLNLNLNLTLILEFFTITHINLYMVFSIIGVILENNYYIYQNKLIGK